MLTKSQETLALSRDDLQQLPRACDSQTGEQWFAIVPTQESKPKQKREKNVITFPTRAKAAQVMRVTA